MGGPGSRRILDAGADTLAEPAEDVRAGKLEGGLQVDADAYGDGHAK